MRNLVITIIAIGAVLVGTHQVRSMDQSKDKQMRAIPEDARTAVFAGGCFWCTESDFEKVDGVIDAISGYTGGKEVNPTYQQVSAGRTGHVEAVKVVYDPEKITYAELLDVFWRHMDPTDEGGQFVDRGAQYASAIFYADDDERRQAEMSKKDLAASGRFDKPIVTPILPLGPFYPAEEYHQDYYKKSAFNYKRYRSGSGRDQFIEKIWGKDMSKTSMKSKPEGAMYTIPSDEELRTRLTALQYKVTRQNGTERPFQQHLLGQPRGRHLRRYHFRRASLQFHGQVRIRHGLAQLYPAPGKGKHRGKERHELFDGTHRSPQQACRLAPRAPVQRRPGPHRPALLHQLGRPALHPQRRTSRKKGMEST